MSKYEESENPRKDAALELAARGFYVLAVKAGEKRPDPLLAPNGFKDATNNAEVVGAWFDTKPRANVGVACGASYGLLVVDVDTKNGAHGMETLRELWEDTLTLTANTPSGGVHLYYRHPGVPLIATLDGIDLKGAAGGGYVVAPGSTLANGAYTWRDDEIPIAEFPANLLAQLRADKKRTNGTAKPASGPAQTLIVPQGQRHSRLVELGAVYRGRGLAGDEIETLLWEHARRYFDPPFSPDNAEQVREIEAVVRWYGAKEGDAETPGPLKILDTRTLRELARATPHTALLDPPLPEAGSLMIYGQAGIGKSHVGLCIAGALATGTTFLDWTTQGAVPVLYVDGEMPLDELDARIAAYFGDDPLPHLRWVAARAQEEELPNLADPAAQALYLAAVLQTGAKVAIFDNLGCLRLTSADLSENSVEAWQPVGAFIRRLNRLGVAVVLIHHASKSGGQRGSTAHVAPMDTVLALRPLGEGQADPLAENDIEFVFEKHRRFGGEAAQLFRAKAIGDAEGRVIWQRAGEDPLVDDVVRLRLAGVSIREIARTLKRSKAGIQKAVMRARARGLLPLSTADE